MGYNLWAKLYRQNFAIINGRKVWHYLIDTAIGQFNVIEYEKPSFELDRIVYDNFEKAEKKFTSVCKKMLLGTK